MIVEMKINSKALKFGDNINTDIIIPGKYLTITDEKEMGKHAMDGIDPKFAEKSRGGTVLVVGENFGSGSSREQAPIALKNADVKCVVAKSFARIFYRNAINIGLPVLECSDLWADVQDGDLLGYSRGRNNKEQQIRKGLQGSAVTTVHTGNNSVRWTAEPA